MLLNKNIYQFLFKRSQSFAPIIKSNTIRATLYSLPPVPCSPTNQPLWRWIRIIPTNAIVNNMVHAGLTKRFIINNVPETNSAIVISHTNITPCGKPTDSIKIVNCGIVLCTIRTIAWARKKIAVIMRAKSSAFFKDMNGKFFTIAP